MCCHRALLFFVMLSGLTAETLSAQVLINEICASNNASIEDEFGAFPDWIELYNAGENALNLAGYSLSDDPADPAKWSFPEIILEPDDWLLVFASDRNVVATNPHTNFKLSASGENVVLSNPAGLIVDQLNFPALSEDQSYGRLLDGSSQLALFTVPSPGSTNNDAIGSGFANSPEWITKGHFFATAKTIQLSHSNPEAMLFFTRDGSIPDTSSERYTGALQLDTTTALRVVAIVPDLLPSPVISRTFFINEDHQLPIMSVIGTPEDLWSWERGILVDGGPNAEEAWPHYGSNYWSEEEHPIHTEFFTADRELGIAFEADTKVHGGRGARTNPMKPLRILVKKKYGSSTVNYPFFPDRERTTYKRLILRNASGDYNNAHFRDAFLARYFIKNNLNLDVMAHRPVVLYVNGAFYGVANLREKSDEYYLLHNYGVATDQVDLLEEDTTVVLGDFVAFDSMYQYVMATDLREEANFQQAAAYFDVENIAEGFIVQSGLNNGDWLHNNIKYWRERSPEARWRYLIFDLDIAMGRHGWSAYYQNNLDSLLTPLVGSNKHVDLFLKLLENDNYRHYFINRYADLFNTIFRPEIFRREVDQTVAEIATEMPRHFDRWGWPGYDLWANERIPVLYEYLENRPEYAREDVRDYFGLPNEVKLRLQTYPPGAGTIQISTIEADELPWEGFYFNGVPVRLTIKPYPGYQFQHWQSEKTIISPDPAISIRYNFEEDDEIVAYFSDAPTEPQMEAYVNSEQELQVGLTLPDADEVSFSLFDTQGRLLQRFPEAYLPTGYNARNLPIPALPMGVYILTASGKSTHVSVKFVSTN
ncbi:CotH kinase family protein [Lewinella sp. LCG006]|uniref:CotH kinase family protein n=1 Tax=Lewinella sp. LCG006 TaxID=3231911 RepID=UPI003460AAFE